MMSSGLTIKITEMTPNGITPASPAQRIEWITSRLSKGSLEGFEEAIERQRFAFTANDITITDINNYDDYFDYFPNKYYGGHPFCGITVEIYWDGTIVYLGYVRSLDDLELNDENKTVSIHCYTWQKRLADLVFEDGFTSRGNIDAILADLWSEWGALLSPNPTFEGFRSSITGVIDINTGVKIDIGEYDDIWWDGRTETWWGIKGVNWGSGGSTTIKVYKIYNRANALLIKEFDIDFNAGMTTTQRTISSKSIRFCPAVLGNDYVGIWIRIETLTNIEMARIYVMKTDGTIPYIYAPFPLDEIVYSFTVADHSIIGNYKYLIKEDGTIRYFSEDVWADFENYYLASHIVGTSNYQLNKYTPSGSFIASYIINSPYSNTAIGIRAQQSIFVPNVGLIMWYQTIPRPWELSKWYWSYLDGGIETRGIGSEQAYLGGVYFRPIGYIDEYLGKYSYGGAHGEWFSNDTLFTRTIEVNYTGAVTVEEILCDLCQLCNGNLYVTPDGYINLYDRGTAQNNHTISLAYVNKKGRGREYKDLRLTEPSLQIKTPLTDNPNDPYDTTRVKGILRTYYRDELQEVWEVWRDEIPLKVGKAFYLGDSISENETGYIGLICKRGLTFRSGERMVEFTLERILE